MMWGTAKKAEEPPPESLGRDRSYLRALHPAPSGASSDSSPFDERSAAERVAAARVAAVSVEERKEGDVGLDEKQFDDAWESAAAASGIANERPADAAPKVPGIRSASFRAARDRASPDSLADLKGELLYYSGKAPLTKEELLYFSHRASPSSLGDHSGDSHSTKRSGNISCFSYKSQPSAYSSAYSTNSIMSRVSSRGTTASSKMSAEEAAAAYDAICPPRPESALSGESRGSTGSNADGPQPRDLAVAPSAAEETQYTAAGTQYTVAKVVKKEESPFDEPEAESEEADTNEPKEAGDDDDAEDEPGLTTVVSPSTPRLSEHIGQTVEEKKEDDDALDVPHDVAAFAASSQSTRGKMSLRKLKSKRLFGKSKKATDVAEVDEEKDGVATKVRVLSGGDEEDDKIELAYGSVPLQDSAKAATMSRVGSTKSHLTEGTANLTLDTKEEEEEDEAPAVVMASNNSTNGMLSHLLACAAPFGYGCESPGNFSQHRIERAVDSPPMLLYEDDVDEALNVEVDDEKLYIGEEFEALRQLHDELAEEDAQSEFDEEKKLDDDSQQKKGKMGLFKRKKGKKETKVDRPIEAN